MANTVTLNGDIKTDAPTGSVAIRIENVSLSFGGVKALSEISVDVRDNEILAIIGPNGA